MENNYVETEKSVPLAKLIYKNLVLIIMVIVLTSLIGLGYAIVKVKPTYTVNRSFIIRMAKGKATENNEAALGKLHMPEIEPLLKLPKYIEQANEIYSEEQNGQTEISAGAIGVKYNDESLIFTLSYTDDNIHDAAAKIHAIYLVASKNFASDLTVDSVRLIDIDNVNIDVEEDRYEGMSSSVNGGYSKHIVLGACVGLVISVCILVISYALDNTLHSKEELEQMTGASVLAFITKNKD